MRILFLRCAHGVSSAPFELHCFIIQRNVARWVLQAAARGTAARSDATDVYSFSKISLAAIIVFKLAHLPVARDGLGDYSTMLRVKEFTAGNTGFFHVGHRSWRNVR